MNVTGLVARIDITNSIFSKRSNDCSEYVENYSSNVRDLTRVLDFDGYVDIASSEEFCEIYSDNIPNHDFNDSSAGLLMMLLKLRESSKSKDLLNKLHKIHQ